MRTLLAALLLIAPASAQVIEDFEHGNENLYVVVNGAVDSFNVTAAAAHDGAFGGEFTTGVGPSWRLRSDLPTAPGNVYRFYARLRGGVATNGRSYVGVGAVAATGAWSAVFAPNTSQIILQNNVGYGFVNAAVAAATIVPDVWYQMRLDWAANGDMTLDLLDEAGTTVQATTGVVTTGYTTPGGIALRGFTTSGVAFQDIDTISGPQLTIGTNYCGPGVVNSTGASGTLSASGSVVVASNDLTLTASSLPNNAFGYFLTSVTQGFVPQPGGSLGALCLGGSIGRYVGPGQIQNTGGTGAISLLLDLTQTPTPTGPVAITAGQTWNFQAWHRDSVGGAAVSNFTDGLSVLFQ
jgi:hypothetical protein